MCNNQREEKNPPKHMLHRKIKAFYPSQTSSFFLSGHPMFMNHNALQFHKIQTLERHGFLSKNSTIYKGSVFFSFLFFSFTRELTKEKSSDLVLKIIQRTRIILSNHIFMPRTNMRFLIQQHIT
jgi:hypothetical protein